MGGNIVLDKRAFLPPPIEAGESCPHSVERNVFDVNGNDVAGMSALAKKTISV